MKRYEVVYTNKEEKVKMEHVITVWANNKTQAKTAAGFHFEHGIVIKRINAY